MQVLFWALGWSNEWTSPLALGEGLKETNPLTWGACSAVGKPKKREVNAVNHYSYALRR